MSYQWAITGLRGAVRLRSDAAVFVFASALSVGCVSYESNTAAWYRQDRTAAPVYVDVRSELNSVDDSPLAQTALRVTSELPNAVAQYLQSSGLRRAETESELGRTLILRVQRLGYGLANPTDAIQATLKIKTSLIVDGALKHEYEVSAPINPLSQPTTLANRFAQSVVDDSLLIWHPEPSVVKRSTGKLRGGPGSLLVMEEGLFEPDKPVTLRWEEFPSMRLLTGSGVSPTQISDVRYEVMLRRDREHPWIKELHATGLLEPQYTLPTVPPYCGRFSWSARARFRLDGSPRVTEWTHAKWTDPLSLRRPDAVIGLGLRERVGAPDKFKCSTKSGWFSANNYDQSSGVARVPTKLQPLDAGDKIAAFVFSNSSCGRNTGQCSSRSHSKNSRIFARMIGRELRKLHGAAEVVSGLEVLGLMPDPPTEPLSMSMDAVRAAISDDENRLALLNGGIRRAVFFYSNADQTTLESFSTGGDRGVAYLQWETYVQLAVNADILDIASSMIEAQLEIIANAEDKAGIALFFLIPIPYASDEVAFDEGVEQIARPVAFVLEGGRSGWGPEWVDRQY